MVVNAEQAEGVLFDGGVAEGEFDRRARGLAAGVDEILLV
jgi:hypothetical protein